MPKKLDAIGSILETLTGVLELEYIKKQKRTSNEYDNVVAQLEKIVGVVKSRLEISKEEGKPLFTDSKGKEYWGGLLPEKEKKPKKPKTEGIEKEEDKPKPLFTDSKGNERWGGLLSEKKPKKPKTDGTTKSKSKTK